MRRYGTTISLAACLVFLLGATAMAANSVTVESPFYGINTPGATAGISIENDIDLSAFVMPIELRTVSGGAYITGTFTVAIQNRLGASGLEDFATKLYFSAPAGVNSCSGPVSNSYSGGAPGPNGDGVSPDGYLYAGLVTLSPNAAAGADAPGSPSFVVTFNCNGSDGTFIIDTMCVTAASHLAFVDPLVNEVIPVFNAGTVTLVPDQCPQGGAAAADPVAATVGSMATNTVSAADDNDPVQYFMISGPGSVNASTGEWSYIPTCGDYPGFDVSIEATDNRGQGGCTANPITFHVNVAPTAMSVGCSNVSVHAGALASQTVSVSGGCPPYNYSVDLGTIDGSGNWEYQTACAETQSVIVTVSDATGQQQTCGFQLDVTNTAPACDGNVVAVLFPQNVNTSVQLNATDADGDALTYALVSGTGWVDENLTASGLYSGTRPAGDGNAYAVVYTVTDGCQTTTCTFDVIFVNPCIEVVDLESGDPYSWVLNGRNHTIGIKAAGGSIPGGLAGGFDFLICYDASGLSFLGASQPGAPEGPGWEYFTYRTGMFGGNCGGGCPDGYIRLLSIADMNDGNPLDPANFNVDGDILAELTFFVTADRNFINSCFHVGFCSYDCGDNSVSDPDGNILWVGRDDGGLTFGPDYWASCQEGKPGYVILREISFCGGAICIMEPPDDRGDINLNGIANEVGDAVLLTNYFIYGSSVWSADAALREVQILSTDINDDGIVLTVADLIYLIRILTGDAAPFPPGTGTGSPKLSPYANSVDVVTNVSDGAITTRTMSSTEVGGAVFVYRYSGLAIGDVEVLAGDNMKVQAAARNGELRVVVHPDYENGGLLAAGSHELVRVNTKGNGSIELVESHFADANGALLSVNAASRRLPESYALKQNYPNPFNAGTVIPVDLKEATDWTLTVYNVAGQVVKTFAGHDAGSINVAWDGRSENGSNVASGVYFYRIAAGDYTATKSMVLMK